MFGARLCFATLLFAAAAPAVAADWPQWRGPGRDGVWPEPVPEHFPAGGLAPRWRRPVGGGYGGIAVAGGRAYLLDRRKGPPEVERVLCLDAATGRPLWTHEYPAAYGKMEYGNGPRATPTVHAGRVYTFGAVGHLHCLDAATGKVVWAHDTVKGFKARVPTWGHACSPLADGDRLVVQIGGEPDADLVAFDPHTGKELWRSLPDRPGYASPQLIEAGGVRQLLYWTPENVVGLDPATGKPAWKVPYQSTYDVSISDPVWHDGVLLVSGYWEGGKAVRLGAPQLSGAAPPEVLWQGKRLSCLMSTPLVRDGHVYALDKREGLKCIELRTGAVKWAGQHVTPKDTNPHASLVWTDGGKGGLALILNTPGELVLARLTPDGYKERDKAVLIEGGTWAHPAFAGGCVFARNDKEVVCVPLR